MIVIGSIGSSLVNASIQCLKLILEVMISNQSVYKSQSYISKLISEITLIYVFGHKMIINKCASQCLPLVSLNYITKSLLKQMFNFETVDTHIRTWEHRAPCFRL